MPQETVLDYEALFPLAILSSRKRAEELEMHRLRTEYPDDVDLLVTPEDDPVCEDGFEYVLPNTRWSRDAEN